jgi:N-acetylglutamate synthase-like GNAT family acetyltransferase
MENRIGRHDIKVFVAAIGNQVTGYVVCSISETDKASGDIRVICVLPEYRSTGVGTALISQAFDFLRANNVRRVHTVTETTEGFYKNVGFNVDKSFVRPRKQIQ